MPSAGHIAMTVSMLRQRGVTVDDSRRTAGSSRPGEISPGTWSIEPDVANAAPFLAAALLTGGRVTRAALAGA